jgi:hypothetical protein
VAGVLDGWFAEDRVFVGLDGIAAAVAKRNYRTKCVIVIVIRLALGLFDHTNGFIDTLTVNVFT